MGPYYIPRNVKDEGRILFIFTGKSLIYTAVGVGIGVMFNLILSAFGAGLIGMMLIAVFALIGFAIGTFKVPNIGAFAFTKKVGGEPIDQVILRAIKFKKSNNKIYVYDKEETKDE
ncbi:MAG: PrgI family protein [Clostridia bacterium]|nr:PrgI family protein [Clostridia bacterium]